MASSVFAFGAAAQDEPARLRVQLDKLAAEAKMISVEGGVMGPAVKGAPYSADEVRESNQVLGDGTRIHNESRTTVYRDSEGRVRRETPTEISIWDPVAGANYVLNPKTMTARKMSMKFVVSSSAPGSAQAATLQSYQFSYSSRTGAEMPVVMFEDAQLADEAKAKAAEVKQANRVTTQSRMPAEFVERGQNVKKESLGAQMMEGVNSQGNRVTTTIETGAIGNDRPIQRISEVWYSPELQMNVMTRRADPRTGEEIMKLTNIQKGEQSLILFEVPPGYNVLGR
jgi:hypothetical protein